MSHDVIVATHVGPRVQSIAVVAHGRVFHLAGRARDSRSTSTRSRDERRPAYVTVAGKPWEHLRLASSRGETSRHVPREESNGQKFPTGTRCVRLDIQSANLREFTHSSSTSVPIRLTRDNGGYEITLTILTDD